MKKLLLVLAVLMSFAAGAYAQGCAMCTKTAAGLEEKSAKGLNNGIIYLATLPLAIIGTVGFIWWKSNKAQE
ncbi:MAG: hypothetical protein EOP56_16940 [Sphingobacteriales bacterium]|nr:MAG: hypothetical protein EOP56_16940 [Sphingobacteriales bacterium]